MTGAASFRLLRTDLTFSSGIGQREHCQCHYSSRQIRRDYMQTTKFRPNERDPLSIEISSRKAVNRQASSGQSDNSDWRGKFRALRCMRVAQRTVSDIGAGDGKR
jgi:hypothetical protein